MIKNTVDFTIGIAPDNASIKQDMLFIKSALLYADTITLISPMASTYYNLTNKANRNNEKTLFELIKKVFLLCQFANQSKCSEMKTTLDEFGEILNGPHYESAPVKVRLQVKAALNEFSRGVSEVLDEMLGQEDCSGLLQLVNNGKVKLYDFKNTFGGDEYVYEFFTELKRSVVDMNNFPLLDKISNNLIKSAINDHVIALNEVNEFNVKHAGLTTNMLISLPSFEFASTDEILDIRKELEDSLTRFRSKMLLYNNEIQSMPWDEEFQFESVRLYQKEVAPSILEIDELTRETGFIKNLGYSLLTDESGMKVTSGLVMSIAAAGVISNYSNNFSFDATILAAGGTYGVSKVAKTLKESKANQSFAKKKDLYFYYKAGRLLDNLKR